MKKLLFVVVTSAIFLLVGCEQENPLINDYVTSYLKRQIYSDPEVMQCGSYYAGYSGSDSLKEKCDKWSINEFESLSVGINVPHKATIENFRDPAFWKIVIPKNSK